MLAGLKALLNARTALIVALTLAGSATTGYFYGGKHMKNRMIAELARENELAQEVFDAAVKGAAQEIANIEIVNTTIREELEREVRYETRYLECRHDDDTYRLLNALLSGEVTLESLDLTKLPEADSAQ